MKVEQYCVGEVGTNCYFLINDETKETLVIDPGDAAGRLAGRIREEGLQPRAILLTHGPCDGGGGTGGGIWRPDLRP